MIRKLAVCALAVLALAGCDGIGSAPTVYQPGNHVTFVVDVFRLATEEQLNVPVHTTVYLEPPRPDLHMVDKGTGQPMTFPFEVPSQVKGSPPGTYPTSPIEQSVFFDYRDPGEFIFRVKATFTGEFGMTLRCRAYDRDNRPIGTIDFKSIDHPRDTVSVECIA
jgi:hypothetical protein